MRDTAELLAHVRELVSELTSVAVFSGAGMSAESGVPTFRDAQTGLWEKYSPEQLATEEALRAEPELVWSWLRWMARLINATQPNTAHTAVAKWQKQLNRRGGSLRVITQNMDDLHERAGAEVLSHLHGTLFSYRCIDCGRAMEHDVGVATEDEVNADPGLADLIMHTPEPCGQCATGFLRPDLVMFGEMLPAQAFEDAITTMTQVEAVVVVGTSSVVQPAASLPFLAAENGATIIEINPLPTGLTQHADIHLPLKAAQALPHIVPTNQDS